MSRLPNAMKICSTTPHITLPPPPCRFTQSEWTACTKIKHRCADDQNQLADRILAESKRVIDDTGDIVEQNRLETEIRLKERIDDVAHQKNELERIRTDIGKELEYLCLMDERLRDLVRFVKEEFLKIIRMCITAREGRLGVDLAHDDVEMELKQEIKVVDGAAVMLVRGQEELKERIRILRSTRYLVDRDLDDKTSALALDNNCLQRKLESLELSMYHGMTTLAPADLSVREWQLHFDHNLKKFKTCLDASFLFRDYLETIMKQAIDDIKNQYNGCNAAFRRGIERTKEEKQKLENELFEINRQVHEMSWNITELEKAIAEKENYMALAHTRLGTRSQRSGAELVHDEVDTRLLNEIVEIKENVQHLQQMLSESLASQRYLLKTQIQLQEDINIKMNTLKIDEVDCMTPRLTLTFHYF